MINKGKIGEKFNRIILFASVIVIFIVSVFGLFGCSYIKSYQEKQHALNQLNQALKDSINRLGESISKNANREVTVLKSVEVQNYDWQNDDFYGAIYFSASALTDDDKTIDFFTVKFSIREDLYIQLVDHLESIEAGLDDLRALKKFIFFASGYPEEVSLDGFEKEGPGFVVDQPTVG